MIAQGPHVSAGLSEGPMRHLIVQSLDPGHRNYALSPKVEAVPEHLDAIARPYCFPHVEHQLLGLDQSHRYRMIRRSDH